MKGRQYLPESCTHLERLRWAFGGAWAELYSNRHHSPWQGHCTSQTFILFWADQSLFQIVHNHHQLPLPIHHQVQLVFCPAGSSLPPSCLDAHRVGPDLSLNHFLLGFSAGPFLQPFLGSQTHHVLTQGSLTWVSG